jgi:hypothetical protein
MVYSLVFHAYINEMQVQEAESPVRNLVRQRCAEGFNSGVKGLITKQVMRMHRIILLFMV